jgi:hypothetical protein
MGEREEMEGRRFIPRETKMDIRRVRFDGWKRGRKGGERENIGAEMSSVAQLLTVISASATWHTR